MKSTPRRGGAQAPLCERRAQPTDISGLDPDCVASAPTSKYENQLSHARWVAYLSRRAALGGSVCGGRS